MATEPGWFGLWFSDGYFPSVWFAPGDDTHLTPDERRKAREQYKSISKLPPEQQTDVRQKWEEYQSLPPEKKRELAAKPPASGNKIPAPASTPPGAKPGTAGSR